MDGAGCGTGWAEAGATDCDCGCDELSDDVCDCGSAGVGFGEADCAFAGNPGKNAVSSTAASSRAVRRQALRTVSRMESGVGCALDRQNLIVISGQQWT